MKALLFTPIASPFLEQPYKELATMDPAIDVVPVFYSNRTHRPTWGKLTWEGHQLSGSFRERIKQINQLWDKIDPDLVILSQYICKECWFARAKARKKNIPYYMAFLEPLAPSGWVKTGFKRLIFKNFASKAAGLGVMGKRANQEYGDMFKGKIINTPYSFDLNEMLSFDDSLRPKDKLVFLYSGRLVDFRDPLGTVRAFAELHRRHPGKVELIISGTGELEDAVQKLIQAEKIGTSVRWMNDFKNWNDIRNLYRYAHVLLSLGKHSTWNLTISEAMAGGMGVIATCTTEAANTLILDDVNGYLVHHGDKDATVAAMEKFLMEKNLIQGHREISRKIVKTLDCVTVSHKLHRLLV